MVAAPCPSYERLALFNMQVMLYDVPELPSVHPTMVLVSVAVLMSSVSAVSAAVVAIAVQVILRVTRPAIASVVRSSVVVMSISWRDRSIVTFCTGIVTELIVSVPPYPAVYVVGIV